MTRNALLDAAEGLMLSHGYAAVTYRRVASQAGVTAGLVQYYFPALDDLFLALLRRRSDANLERLQAALEGRPDQPLRTLWEFSRDETTAALMLELMALGNHRKAIRSEIADGIDRFRKVQMEVMTAAWARYGIPQEFPPAAALFLLLGLPKLLLMESDLGVDDGHVETLALVERYLDQFEPSARRRIRRPPKTT